MKKQEKNQELLNGIEDVQVGDDDSDAKQICNDTLILRKCIYKLEIHFLFLTAPNIDKIKKYSIINMYEKRT